MTRRSDDCFRIDVLGRQWSLERGLQLAERQALKGSEKEDAWAQVDRTLPSLRLSGPGVFPTSVEGAPRQSRQSAPRSLHRFDDGLVALVRAIVTRLRGLLESQFNSMRYLGPLRSYPGRHVYQPTTGDPDWLAGGAYAWDLVARDEVLRTKINRWLGQRALQTRYELTVQAFVALDELRSPLLAHLESIREETAGQDAAGEGLEGEEASLNVGLGAESGELDWRLDDAILSIRQASSGVLTSLGLKDLRTNTLVSHRDVGIGISQVLPVLALAHAAKESLVAIEQPELHLHPALQAELADVFIESALTQKNAFVLETHSEHLLLRILRRIRESRHSDGPSRLTPEHVSVLFVESTDRGARATQIPIREDGEFDAPWPQGFFPERLQELV